MKVVNIHEAKTKLSQLLIDMASGEDVVIARNGCPIARLVPFDKIERTSGLLRDLPGWRNYDPKTSDAFAPMTDEELEAEGWPRELLG